ncbi:hypothetical protein JZU57_02525, partial [bacterium]|nr:hypothetical protein [bacterium]
LDGETLPTKTGKAVAHGLDEFYHHQVTPDDWNQFDEADKAILDAASHWAYGEDFKPGDYLVTVAMHVNTRELPTWTMQSVWWSPNADKGAYSLNRPDLPDATGPWKKYLMVDSYG